jgi:hypothetical protein
VWKRGSLSKNAERQKTENMPPLTQKSLTESTFCGKIVNGSDSEKAKIWSEKNRRHLDSWQGD